jgi:hypothetical protein
MSGADKPRSVYGPRRDEDETILTRSRPVRITLGLKAWSTLSAMLLALVMISGCNDEGTTTPATPPTLPPPPAVKSEPPKSEPTPPPPTKAEEKPTEKK